MKMNGIQNKNGIGIGINMRVNVKNKWLEFL